MDSENVFGAFCFGIAMVCVVCTGLIGMAMHWHKDVHEREELQMHATIIRAVDDDQTPKPLTRAMAIERFFVALEAVETGGHPDPANAVGDGGASLGWLQIGRAYYTDSGYRDLPYEQACRDRYASRLVAEGFFKRYAPEAWDRGDWEVLAMLHNRGPAGALYWKKVKQNRRE